MSDVVSGKVSLSVGTGVVRSPQPSPVEGTIGPRNPHEARGEVISIVGELMAQHARSTIESLAGTLHPHNRGSLEIFAPETSDERDVAFVVNPGGKVSHFSASNGDRLVLGSFVRPHSDIPDVLTKKNLSDFFSTLHLADVAAVISLPSADGADILCSGLEVFYIVTGADDVPKVKGALMTFFGEAVATFDEPMPTTAEDVPLEY